MKFSILFPVIFIGSLSLLTLISCHKDNINREAQQSLSISKNIITLDSIDGSDDTIAIYSTLRWKATVSPGVDWLQLDKTSGVSGKTIMRVTFSPTNQPVNQRSATITFSANDNNSVQPVTLTITIRSFSFNFVFRKAFGGTNDDEPGHHSIVKTPDGGTIILGTTNSHDGDVSGTHGGYDAWLLKLNSSGEKEWSKTYGGSGDEGAASVIVTSDGFLEVTGYTYSHDGDVSNHHGESGSDLWVMKLNENGDVVWSKAFGGTLNEAGRAIVATPDGGCAIAGFASSTDGDVHDNHGDGDVWLLRLNGLGDTLWTASYGGSSWDEGANITLSPDGGFALTGLTYSNDGDVSGFHTPVILGADVWVVKLNSNGKKIWTKTLGGSADDVGQAIVVSPGGGYIVTAYAQSNDGDISGHHGNSLFNDMWVVKLDDDGNKIWERSFGGNLDEAPTAIIAAPDGGFIMIGGTDSHDGDFSGAQAGDYNMCILKFDDNGHVSWSKKLGGTGDDTFYSIAMDTGGGLLLLGSTNSNDGDITGTGYHGEYDLWLTRLAIQ